MQYDSKILDDLAYLTTGAIGSVVGLRQEVEAQLRQQCECILSQLDVVTREEFEITKAMATKARREQEELRERLAQLETLLESTLMGHSPKTTSPESIISEPSPREEPPQGEPSQREPSQGEPPQELPPRKASHREPTFPESASISSSESSSEPESCSGGGHVPKAGSESQPKPS